MTCKWPSGACAYYEQEALKPDHAGRVWMHCEQGLSMTSASMARFMMFCLRHNVEIGSVHPFNPKFERCLVIASVRIKPDQIAEFEVSTGGKLRKPPKIHLNSASPSEVSSEGAE